MQNFGSGTVHHHKSAWGDFEGKTEAEVFAAKAIEEGSKDLFIKNRSKHSSNTLLSLLRFFMNKSLSVK